MARVSVVIFGATGFTGKYAAIEMARMVQKQPDLTWAVAGRSQSKLENLMREVAETTGEDQSHVKMIIADVTDEESLKAMCRAARVVANCCGPYRLYGEPVVRAAVENGAHHVDITGEPQFIETMQLKYDAAAREAGVFVVSACGYDSVPNDLGVVYLQDHFGGTLNSVESYMSTSVPDELREAARAHGFIHSGTWESLVYGLAHWDELKPLRQKMFPTRLPTFKPKLEPRRPVHRRGTGWCIPFAGADNSVVYRSQRHRHDVERRRPAQFRAYIQLEKLMHAVVVIAGMVLFAILARFKFTRELMLKYPRIFTGGYITAEGPSKEVSEGSRFTVELCGEGWEGDETSGPCNKRVVARVSGTNPGYGATVVALLQCAATLLNEPHKLPEKGGVVTTAVAFRNTSLIQKLNENGIKFEIISSSTI